MRNRIISFVLALVFIVSCVAMSACKPAAVPGPNDGNGGTSANGGEGNNPGGETKPQETEAKGEGTNANGLPLEYFENYAADPNAKYTGKVGIGSGSGASYDKLRVNINLKQAFSNDFESSTDLPEGVYSVTGGSLSDWKVGEDSVKKGNNAVAYTGSDKSVLTYGNTAWGASNVVVSLALEEGGYGELYFCYKDENNYYRITVSSKSEDGIRVVEVKDGTETTVGQLSMAFPTGKWANVSATVDLDSVTIYIDGAELFHIGGEKVEHVYSGLMGIAQWNTEFYVDNIKVDNPLTGEVYYEQDFEDGKFLDTAKFGARNGASWSVDNASDWEIVEVEGNHVLHFKNSGVYGAVVLFDPKLPENCTAVRITYQGYKINGSEGYAVVWDWKDGSVDKNGHGADYMAYNLGGWSGKSGFQEISGGTKTNHEGSEVVGIEVKKWQTVEVTMMPDVIYGGFEGTIYEIFWQID